MKKILSILLVFIILPLSGCGRDSEEVGSSPENPVPIGEYVDICPGNREVQLCITEVISGEEAKRLADTDNDLVIVKFKLKAVSLKGKRFSASPYQFMILNNGTIESASIFDLKNILDLPNLGIDTFVAEGEIDCKAVFWVDINDCRCLQYNMKNPIYFAIRENAAVETAKPSTDN